jgi:hypothetical protein
MSNFPLYDNLCKNIKKKDLTSKQKDEFIIHVNSMDSDGRELIYALIRTHKQQDSSINKGLPYSGVDSDGSPQFNLDKFPSSLKQILYKFMNLHLQKIQEEHQLESQRV